MMDQVIILKPSFSYAFLRCFGLMLISCLILFAAIYFELPILLIGISLPALMMFYRIIYWRRIKYELTTNQIKYGRGVLSRRVDFLEMYRIKDFDQKQSLIMNILGIMHIRLMTSDISHPMLELKGIPVSNITDVIRQLVEKSRKENRVYAID